ncbi:MAG: hypothetical protein RUMPE_00741 [Eubacteriales bacterium SKADARSKE-1]|nr:hypothetical protein [Eubacteriales bacterium SKADARSKE-1]
MKATGVIRPIDDLGRIVLPIELRKVMNLNSKDLLEIFVDGPQIILKKYHKSCIFCGENEDLIDFKGQCICEKCKNDLKKSN